MKKAGKKYKIGFMGLGKLGLPVALAIESKGHSVVGYDVNPEVARYLKERKIPYKEEGAQEFLSKTNIKILKLEEVVKHSEIIFVPIQTPHHSRYEGVTRIPRKRVDFEYTYLKNGIQNLAKIAAKQKKHVVLAIISTVLPGTIEREIKPVLNKYTHLVYEPLFIAMGTTIRNFLNPEFVIMGVDEKEAAKTLKNFYSTIHDKLVYECSIKSAELIKVAYNTYIGMKIVFANTMMEISHHTGADVDSVTKAIGLANDRLMSPKYLTAGMGDGGGCHPRDNIALSWLAKELKLSHDIFENLMHARENQTDWLADLIEEYHQKTRLPIIILGKAFKPETNLTVGSPATLLANLLKERNLDFIHYDPHTDNEEITEDRPSLYFIATKHASFKIKKYPKGSTVLDPFRYVDTDKGINVIHIGKN